MANSDNSEALCKLTVTVETSRRGAMIGIDGGASMSALASLQMVIANHLSSHFDDGYSEDAIILQGQIVNSATRLAKMMGHAKETVLSEEAMSDDARAAHRAAVEAGYADLAGYVETYGKDGA